MTLVYFWSYICGWISCVVSLCSGLVMFDILMELKEMVFGGWVFPNRARLMNLSMVV